MFVGLDQALEYGMCVVVDGKYFEGDNIDFEE